MPAHPLAALGLRLMRVAPPSLKELREALLVAEGFAEFLDLVQRYLPDHEQEILQGGTPEERIAIFANHFKHRYFPLHWVFEMPGAGDVDYDYMVSSIHTMVLGWDDDDWHMIEDREPGHQLLFALCRCCDDPHHDDGLRVPTLEACARHTKPATLQRIPPNGYARGELRRLLDGTEFEAAAKAADWFYNDTGNGFLDTPEHMEQYTQDDWTPENVAELTRLWAEADLLTDQVENLRAWLEQDTNKHFAQLLDFIDHRQEVMHRDEPGPKPLIVPTGRGGE